MKKNILLLILIISVNYLAKAQELNCQIQIDHRQIQGTSKEVFEDLQLKIFEFMNNSKWTDHTYNQDERIDCNILISLTEAIGATRFAGTIQVQSRRPVHNTGYYTPILNYKEKSGDFRFEFQQNQSLDFSENTFKSNLTSTLAYYAYVIIGMDYDTFSPEGGTSYFQKAQNIVTNAQVSTEPGWKSFENTENRFWLVDDLLNDAYKPLRNCSYTYHRLGLDAMSQKIEEPRAQIAEAIRGLQKVHNYKPSSFLMKLFFTSKSAEIISLFSKSFQQEKAKVVTELKEIDPARASEYDKITSAQ